MALRVCHVSMECVPFSKVGGMADVVGALPAALRGVGVEASVLTPYYPQVHTDPVGEELGAFDVWIGDAPHRVRLVRGDEHVILVDQPTAYDRPGIYDDPHTGEGFQDSLYRCLVLQLAARVALQRGLIEADVVHCHDNHTGVLPAYLKDDGGPPTVFTIHNLAYQGVYGADQFWLTGISSDRFYGHSGFEYYGDFSLMKSGLSFADLVTTVSPSYAEEIVRPEFGQGLDGVLRGLGDRLAGVINGIDTDLWDPSSDPMLPATFSLEDLAGKAEVTRALRTKCGLNDDPAAPLLGMVSRVTQQKGLDLVGSILPHLMRRGAQVVLLGSGDPSILDLFRGAAGRWPGRVGLLTGYDEQLAHLVYGGADLFLMPSRFEPCGLSQMYAMRYGAVPVVTKMGGLKDTVPAFDEHTGEGVGVLADWATADSFQGAVDYALDLWPRKRLFSAMRRNAMQAEFAWERSALAYVELYERVTAE